MTHTPDHPQTKTQLAEAATLASYLLPVTIEAEQIIARLNAAVASGNLRRVELVMQDAGVLYRPGRGGICTPTWRTMRDEWLTANRILIWSQLQAQQVAA